MEQREEETGKNETKGRRYGDKNGIFLALEIF